MVERIETRVPWRGFRLLTLQLAEGQGYGSRRGLGLRRVCQMSIEQASAAAPWLNLGDLGAAEAERGDPHCVAVRDLRVNGNRRQTNSVRRARWVKSLHGFTLIELLVVISIVALLIALLLPALKRARLSAQQAVCLAHEKQLMMAAINFAQDHKGYLPAVSWSAYRPLSWAQVLPPYLGVGPDRDGAFTALDERMFAVTWFSCPVADPYTGWVDDVGPHGPFGYNCPIAGGSDGFTGNWIDGIAPRTFIFADASTTVVFAPKAGVGWRELNYDWDGDGVNDSNLGWATSSPVFGFYNRIRPRHPGGPEYGRTSINSSGANFAFVDGSASFETMQAFINDEHGMWGNDSDFRYHDWWNNGNP